MYAHNPTSALMKTWDGAGLLASLMCMAHCILTPILATSLPVLAATEEQTHESLAVAIFFVGVLTFVPGYRKHRKINVVVLGGLGLVAIGIAAFLADDFLAERIAGVSTEVALTITGGMCLIVAHVSNAFFCRLGRVCRETPAFLEKARILTNQVRCLG